jgi:hypothetical protein
MQLRLWPKDADTKLPKAHPDTGETPHPFRGFFYPFPASDLPHRPIPSPPVLGLVSTIPTAAGKSPKQEEEKGAKPKLNWIYADNKTRELRYGPRADAREHTVGSWDWTDDEQGLTLEDEECLVAVEEETGGYGGAVYWDREDNRLKEWEVGKEKRVLRCSLERRLVQKRRLEGLDDL